MRNGQLKICVVCHYFWPELGAPPARLKEMADVWISEGHAVTVITNFPNHPTGRIYDGYEQRSFLEENVDGIRVLRCRTYATPNQGFIKKVLSHIWFAFNAYWQCADKIVGTDILIISSPPLFTGIGVWALGKKLKCPYIIEVRDLWPAIFVDLEILKNRTIIKVLESIELFLYRKSAHVVTVTQAFAKDIISRKIPAEKLSLIPNGVDLERFHPGPKSKTIVEEFGIQNKFMVLYLGTHGISQALGSIINTAKLLEAERDIHFVFVGEGADKKDIMKKAEEMQLANVSFMPGQPKERVLDIYRTADVCLVPLRNIPLFETFIPSKMFEVMGAGVPLIAAVEGEAAAILEQTNGGAVVCKPEDSRQLADAILELKNSPAKRKRMAVKGREFVVREFDRRVLAKKYLDLMKQVLSTH